MKFTYGYKTRDNVTREGVVSASSRDAAFVTLKRQGIRPFRVDLAPGFLNRLASIGKRGWAIVALSAVSAAAVAVAASLWGGHEAASAVVGTLDSTTRRQLFGDSAVIEKGIRTGWAEVFPDEGERFLASFAIPGVAASCRNVSADELTRALSRKVEASDADGIEARQIKAIVEGMKSELRRFVEAGGTVAQYGRRLVQRQECEIGYYQRARNELDALSGSGASRQQIERVWEKRNSELRQLGIRLLSLSEGL